MHEHPTHQLASVGADDISRLLDVGLDGHRWTRDSNCHKGKPAKHGDFRVNPLVLSSTFALLRWKWDERGNSKWSEMFRFRAIWELLAGKLFLDLFSDDGSAIGQFILVTWIFHILFTWVCNFPIILSLRRWAGQRRCFASERQCWRSRWKFKDTESHDISEFVTRDHDGFQRFRQVISWFHINFIYVYMYIYIFLSINDWNFCTLHLTKHHDNLL